MEKQDQNHGIRESWYKLSIARKIEENNRKLQEHYKRMQEQEKKPEAVKQEMHSFVCDWQ